MIFACCMLHLFSTFLHLPLWRLTQDVLFALHQEEDKLPCLRLKFVSDIETEVNFANVYAVNFIGWGLVHESALASVEVSLLDHSSEVINVNSLMLLDLSLLWTVFMLLWSGVLSSLRQMYRFTVHVVRKSKTQLSLWTPSVYTFGHKNLEICESWVNQINTHLYVQAKRPKSLLVCFNFVTNLWKISGLFFLYNS